MRNIGDNSCSFRLRWRKKNKTHMGKSLANGEIFMISNNSINLSSLFMISNEKTRSISAENPKGMAGSGGKENHKYLGPSRKGNPDKMPLKKGEIFTIADIEGPAVIRSIWITVPDKTEFGSFVLRDLIFRIYWDDEKNPSVEVPLGDFFCNGFARRAILNSFLIVVNPYGGFNSFFPMPFKKRAVLTIENQHPGDLSYFFYQINFSLLENLGNEIGYFHSHWRRQNPTKKKKDYVIVENIFGKGNYIGTYLAITSLMPNWWGEGEIKFYVDDDEDYPTICGTGTEDYVGGAWCFCPTSEYSDKRVTIYSTPFMGYHYNSILDKFEKSNYPMHGMYRWHVLDPIRFSKKIKVSLQQIGGRNAIKNYFERSDDVSSVAYWYQVEPHNPFPKLPDCKDRWPR